MSPPDYAAIASIAHSSSPIPVCEMPASRARDRGGAARGHTAEGPFPADTVFLRARSGAFDAVLTMYHDQGQIAMKLMGFDRGVTLLGGFPFPICTPAHGTAYDIAGQGKASVGATLEALRLAFAMARHGNVAALRHTDGKEAG
jgi:4-hydroxy-L-threonine phosphate dehydrogenase PdxA